MNNIKKLIEKEYSGEGVKAPAAIQVVEQQITAMSNKWSW